MGCIISLCAGQLLCCCGSAACSLCCSCCPSSVSSVMTRLMYLFVMILGVIVSGIFLIPDVYEALSKKSNIPFFDYSLCDIFKLGDNCEKIVGYQMVYRIWLAYFLFFLLLALLMLGVKSSKDPRAGIHKGFWFFKILILIGAIVGCFFIPANPFNEVWMYFGLIGGLLFVFAQVLYLIDFAHSWTESWHAAADERSCCYFGFFICTLIFYGLALAGWVGMFKFYTSADACNLNKGLVSVLIILCVLISVMSILPRVQEANEHSGLLQASVVSMYATYLTFSALSAEPIRDESKNSTSSALCPYNANTINGGYAMIIVGIVIAVLTVFYLSLKSSGGGGGIADEEGGQQVEDDEEDEVKYNYSLFHVLCLLASLYIMMVMTNWFQPETRDDAVPGKQGLKFAASWPAMWVQIVASWLCILLYIWTLIAPLACPNRNFGFANSGSEL